MGKEQLAQVMGRLGASTEALGALAGALELRASGQRAAPEVESTLSEVLSILGRADLIDDVHPADIASFLNLARARLLQAIDMSAHPARQPGWRYTDPEPLQSQGMGSAAFAPVLKKVIAPRLEGLAERLQRPGATFLDVGVGVAGLTIAMCRLWPTLSGVGIDVWEPALVLARRNVEVAGLEDRIELRSQSLADVTDTGAYDFLWVPISFIPCGILADSMRRLSSATRPGGWVILNMFGGVDDLAVALARLRTALFGGCVMGPAEAEAILGEAGYEQVYSLPKETLPPVWMTVGRRGTDSASAPL